MAEPPKNPLVWLDMEMTGLDPKVCVPLQAAIIVTTPELEELDSMEVVIWQPEARLESMEPTVRRMHTENGLVDSVRKSTVGLEEAERKMMELVVRWCRYRDGVLAGNSIHQDRRFLNAYFPILDGYLHYRMVDVSTIKELTRRWYGPDVSYKKATSTHTALSDVRESVLELRYYRSAIFKPRS